jgi:hypothetical protein
LLLRNAVHAATVAENGPTIDGFDGATRVEPRDDFNRFFIAWVVEGANYDKTIAYVVVDIGVVHAEAINYENRRSGDLDDLKHVAAGISAGTKESYEFLRDFKVGVIWVSLTVGRHEPGPDKGGHDINVPTGPKRFVVTRQAAWQPDCAGSAKLRVNLYFDLLATPLGISSWV